MRRPNLRVVLALALAPLGPPTLLTMISGSVLFFPIAAGATYVTELVFGLPLYLLLRRRMRSPWVSGLAGGGAGLLGVLALFMSLSGEVWLDGAAMGAIVSLLLGLPFRSVGGAIFWAIAFSGLRDVESMARPPI